ncbi:hypothetical protein AB0M43_36750 [Longispora sp. NPDC051575]|uniref:hypothetical protein n=1 Tax=Longispora sp. NPDC051575 TaxID=3154943 RepID=UPI00344062F8
MRQVFVVEAVLEMAADADLRAPGGVVTIALCGSFTHDPPCPVAPHHTETTRTAAAGDQGAGDGAVLSRTVFTVEPADEGQVRDTITAALSTGRLRDPEGTVTCWRLLHCRAGSVTAEDAGHFLDR